MQMWTGVKPGPDRVVRQGIKWQLNTLANRSVLTYKFPSTQTPEDNPFIVKAAQFQNGYIKKGTKTYDIDFSGPSLSLAVWHNPRTGPPPSSADQALFIGQDFELWDDDDRGLQAGTTPLPKLGLISSKVNSYFKPAYIDIVPLPDSNNPRRLLAYRSHVNLQTVADVLLSPLDDFQDNAGRDRAGWWYHFICAAYQADVIRDFDPFEYGGLLGATTELPALPMFSVVLVEAIRDRLTTAFDPLAAGFQDHVSKLLDIVVAHEIGHTPGNDSETLDHAEEGIMTYNPSIYDDSFSPTSLRRFRNVTKWND